jgi:Tfp pilus assembly PilM family ATPase
VVNIVSYTKLYQIIGICKAVSTAAEKKPWRIDLIKKDEITSTEKLLELIRNKSAEPTGSHGVQRVRKKFFARKDNSGAGRRLKKTVKIGIHINDSDITLVAVTRVSEKKQELVEARKIPLGPDVERGSNEFIKLLKGSIKELTGKYTKTSLWATISSDDVETRFLQIPKVPARQVPNAVKWAFQKETTINDSHIFDFKVIDTVYSEGEQKKNVLAYTALESETDSIRQLFNKAGCPLKGVSIAPFAIQNLLREGWIKGSGKNVCTLYIGRDCSRIAIYSKNVLVLSRDIKAGAGSMVQAILETLDKKYIPGADDLPVSSPEAENPVEMAETTRNLEKAKKIFTDFFEIKPPSKEASLDLKRDRQVFGMFKPALDRVIRQVEMTLEHFGLNFDSNPIDNVYISGELSSRKSIVSYMGKQLGQNVEPMDPFSDMPESKTKYPQSETPLSGEMFVPAAGMGLAENETTPNFIFTYIHKEKKEFAKRFNQVANVVFMVLIIVAAGIFYYQTEVVREIKASIQPLQMELDAYSPRLDRDFMAKVAGRTVKQLKDHSVAADYYLPVAVIAEILEITPESVKLTDLQAIMGRATSQKIEKTGKILTVEGVITGDGKYFERKITDYLIRLKKSPFFKKPLVKEKTIQATQDGEALKFVLSMSII